MMVNYFEQILNSLRPYLQVPSFKKRKPEKRNVRRRRRKRPRRSSRKKRLRRPRKRKSWSSSKRRVWLRKLSSTNFK